MLQRLAAPYPSLPSSAFSIPYVTSSRRSPSVVAAVLWELRRDMISTRAFGVVACAPSFCLLGYVRGICCRGPSPSLYLIGGIVNWAEFVSVSYTRLCYQKCHSPYQRDWSQATKHNRPEQRWLLADHIRHPLRRRLPKRDWRHYVSFFSPAVSNHFLLDTVPVLQVFVIACVICL